MDSFKSRAFGNVSIAPPRLTPRELECNSEIGQVLGISEATAHFHVENAKKKLGKSTRTEAVALLVLHGLI